MKNTQEWIKELRENPTYRSQNLAIMIPAIQADALRGAASIANWNEDYVTKGMLKAKAEAVEKGQL